MLEINYVQGLNGNLSNAGRRRTGNPYASVREREIGKQNGRFKEGKSTEVGEQRLRASSRGKEVSWNIIMN